MFIMPSFKKSLIVEQFQGNYLNNSNDDDEDDDSDNDNYDNYFVIIEQSLFLFGL